MKTLLFLVMCAVTLLILAVRILRRRPSLNYESVDAIVAAYNEEPCIEAALTNLLRNRYIARVICVNDGSSDNTGAVLDRLADRTKRLTVLHQSNSGKGGALMHGLRHASSDQVFLTDADTYVPPRADSLGYMLAEIERGADAVGGIPSSNLQGAGLLPFVRATVKFPMIQIKRTFQELLGGAPFIISGACGMFRTDVLRDVGLSDRTKVEDLDLTWSLVARGYKVRLANMAVVYPQECNTMIEEWRRWRRWITGYAVCMRLHWRLLPTRYGLFTILPMFLVAVLGISIYGLSVARHAAADWSLLPGLFFPMFWMGAAFAIGAASAIHHRKFRLLPMAPLAILYVLLAYVIWLVHGLAGLITGREPARDKPTRYAHVVD